jgi:hypothetical protein
MLKIGSKRRRTKTEIEEEKKEAELKQADIEAKLASLAAAMEEVARLKTEAEQNGSANLVLQDLHSKKKIKVDENGHILIRGIDYEDEGEHEEMHQ